LIVSYQALGSSYSNLHNQLSASVLFANLSSKEFDTFLAFTETLPCRLKQQQQLHTLFFALSFHCESFAEIERVLLSSLLHVFSHDQVQFDGKTLCSV
jgi:hypothetical protein